MTLPIFDGHNDFLLRLYREPAKRDAIWQQGDGTGDLDLPRMRKGGMAGGMFAIFLPSPRNDASGGLDSTMNRPPYDLPLPGLIGHQTAQPMALAIAGHLLAMARATPDDLSICLTAQDIESAMAAGRIAAVLHMEGAEAIDPELDALHLFHAMGLRSLGPVWSRPTIFGHGVPFRFPGSPDTGPGLTDAGKRLVRECNKLRILVDLSHLNAQGMDDVAAITDAPLVATHSNAHSITPSTRNLTDRQLDMIRDTGGMVGLNFATVFLRPDGRLDPSCGWEPIFRHLDHLIGRLGEDHVGFGSDFDGAVVPDVIGDVSGMPAMIEALREHGYNDGLLAKLAYQNWVETLRRTWGA